MEEYDPVKTEEKIKTRSIKNKKARDLGYENYVDYIAKTGNKIEDEED